MPRLPARRLTWCVCTCRRHREPDGCARARRNRPNASPPEPSSEAELKFEVTSVKKSGPTPQGGFRFGMMPGGRFTVAQMTRQLADHDGVRHSTLSADWRTRLDEHGSLRHQRGGRGRSDATDAARYAESHAAPAAIAPQGTLRARRAQRDARAAAVLSRDGARGSQAGRASPSRRRVDCRALMAAAGAKEGASPFRATQAGRALPSAA